MFREDDDDGEGGEPPEGGGLNGCELRRQLRQQLMSPLQRFNSGNNVVCVVEVIPTGARGGVK